MTVPSKDLEPDEQPAGSPLVRTEPIQDRSVDRIQELLDAAAHVIDEVGFDRLTTAMVAAKAKSAIGTVYRYFPDRITLLGALRKRETEFFQSSVRAAFQAEPAVSLPDAAELALDIFVEMTRSRPGFRVVQGVDPMRTPVRTDSVEPIGIFARGFAGLLSEQFDIPNTPELLFHMEVAIEISNALAAYAFVVAPAGDPRFLNEAKAVVRDYLRQHYPGK